MIETPRRPPASPERQQIEALQIAEGFFCAQVLFSLNELGVFDELSKGARPASELASATSTVEDRLQRILNAGVCVGLLTLSEGLYNNSDLSDAVLVSGRPAYMGNWMRLMSRWSAAWQHLSESVRTGRPAADPSLHLGADPDSTRDFSMGMHDYAQLRGREIVHYLDFSGGQRLLDLGGGPGTYSILFAKQWPDLRATVFDLPEVVKIAEKNAAAAGVGGRVLTVAGDYQKDSVGEGYDVVFLSDTLHQESPETCEKILRKARMALKPGGRIVVQAMFLNENRTSPRWPVMHSIILMLVYGSGRAYTVRETMAQMSAAGFQNCVHKRMSLLNVNSLILAETEDQK